MICENGNSIHSDDSDFTLNYCHHKGTKKIVNELFNRATYFINELCPVTAPIMMSTNYLVSSEQHGCEVREFADTREYRGRRQCLDGSHQSVFESNCTSIPKVAECTN